MNVFLFELWNTNHQQNRERLLYATTIFTINFHKHPSSYGKHIAFIWSENYSHFKLRAIDVNEHKRKKLGIKKKTHPKIDHRCTTKICNQRNTVVYRLPIRLWRLWNDVARIGSRMMFTVSQQRETIACTTRRSSALVFDCVCVDSFQCVHCEHRQHTNRHHSCACINV